MPGGRTPLDRALNSKNAFFAFSGIIAAAAAWSIWGQDMFPAQPDPTGDPTTWTQAQLLTWLSRVLLTLSLTIIIAFLGVLTVFFCQWTYMPPNECADLTHALRPSMGPCVGYIAGSTEGFRARCQCAGKHTVSKLGNVPTQRHGF